MMTPALDHPTNTWFAVAEALGTLIFSDQGAFTLWVGGDAYTDRWDFRADDSDVVVVMDESRQAQTRLRLGGSLELVMNRQWNAWGLLEGVLVGPAATRRLHGDIFGFGFEDTALYVRLGLTHKF
jgi:hypothetical protein